MFESHIITFNESSPTVHLPCFKWFSVDSTLRNVLSTYWQKEYISLWVKKDKENDTGQMEHLFLMNKKHLSPSIAHSFCAKSN